MTPDSTLSYAVSVLCHEVGVDKQAVSLHQLSTDTYHVHVADRKAEFKLRLQNGQNNRASLVRNEAEALSFLEAHAPGIVCPRLALFDEDASGCVFSIQTYLPGTVLATLATEDERRAQYARFGEYLAHIHALRGTFSGRFCKPKEGGWPRNFTEHFHDDCHDARPALSNSLVNDIRTRVIRMTPAMNVQPCLLHGDTHPGNMVFTGSDVAMFDFHHCLFGDPLFEAGQFFVRITKHDTDPAASTRAFLAGLAVKNFAPDVLDAYILALFVNEIGFKVHTGQEARAAFYVHGLLAYMRSGILW